MLARLALSFEGRGLLIKLPSAFCVGLAILGGIPAAHVAVLSLFYPAPSSMRAFFWMAAAGVGGACCRHLASAEQLRNSDGLFLCTLFGLASGTALACWIFGTVIDTPWKDGFWGMLALVAWGMWLIATTLGTRSGVLESGEGNPPWQAARMWVPFKSPSHGVPRDLPSLWVSKPRRCGSRTPAARSQAATS